MAQTEAVFFFTCEHGGNRVPKSLECLFKDAHNALESHRGLDIGALDLAKAVSSGLNTRLYYSKTTRLVADLNRSIHSKSLFSEFTSILSKDEKERILKRYYLPYRKKVEKEIKGLTAENTVIHISFHSFTPSLNGALRNAEIGILYDPKREPEKRFCTLWQKKLREELPSFRIRMNYPYKGISDSLPLKLKKCLAPEAYSGIELEINQSVFDCPKMINDIKKAIISTLIKIKNHA